MHEAHSFLYKPVNHLLQPLLGFTIPDHVIMGTFLVLLLALITPFWRRSFRLDHPSRIQILLENVIQALLDLMEDVIGHGMGRRYLAIIGAFCFFILLSNLMGLVFFLNPPTSNPNTTFALSILAFLYYNVQGIEKHKLSYIKQFMGPMLAVAIIIFPVEIISHLVRAISLGLRLFGNIFGEHNVSGIISDMAPIGASWPTMLLGIVAAVMQTFIFIMLTMAYIGGAVGEEH